MTLDVRDQPPKFRFRFRQGKIIGHTFDMVWHLKDGRFYYVYTKPSALVKKHAYDKFVAQMAQQLAPGDADGILLLTERETTPVAKRDGWFVFRARQWADPYLDARVLAFCRQAGRDLQISDIASTFDGSLGLYAAARLIASGDLTSVSLGPIDYDMVVSARRQGLH